MHNEPTDRIHSVTSSKLQHSPKMKTARVWLGLSLGLLPCTNHWAADHMPHAHAVVSAETALARLKAGNQRYVETTTSEVLLTAARRAEIAQAQHPFAVIIACADSRVSPEIVFSQNLGDLFVIRSAGNLLDEHALGSVEYAVAHLGTKLVVVLGHERCGAVAAAIDSATAPGHIASLVQAIRPAVERCRTAPGPLADAVVAENARSVAARIRAEAVFGEAAGGVKIIHALYDLDTGLIAWPPE
ncbi:carbonic anhydrase [Opitutus terrae PB90-1]|uniref:Carbonic anhydrase n=2 Tax=Opitutus terrae TaxID=107709 RepID=B1ZTC8_OPITP|nr:carbonic anhydrase [Opitutus terrae PB90-1]